MIRALHIFGRIVDLEALSDLKQQSRDCGEPGLFAGTLLVTSAVAAIFGAVLLYAAIV